MNILHQIATVAATTPEKVAYISEGETISYGELWQKSNEVAAAILAKELPEKSPIIVYGHMSPLQIIGFLGATKAGHPYIPLDISIPSDRISHIIKVSGASFILHTEEFSIETTVENVCVENCMIGYSGAETNSNNWVKGDQVFYIIYTSGSTGNPKGVQISEINLQSFVDWISKECDLPEGVYLNQAPYSFDLSVMDLYPALVKGQTVHTLTKPQVENAAELFEVLEKSEIGIWTSTPSFAKICLMNPAWNEQQMPLLTTFLFCGEVLPHKVARELKIRFPRAKIYNLYGPTETTVAVTAVEVTAELLERYEQLPIAKANTPMLKVVNENLQSVTEGEKGEIAILGPTVSTEGYLNDAVQSAKVFKVLEDQRIYKAGDIAFVKDDYIFYAGRSDFQIKLHGYRMEIEEIEKQIEVLNEVAGCIVVPITKEEEIVSLTACIVLKDELEEKPFKMTKLLKMKLSNHIPSYMVPKKFVYIDALPLTMNGKVNRKRMAVELVL